jgi:two-component system nitrate/nitrite response regulator NarL
MPEVKQRAPTPPSFATGHVVSLAEANPPRVLVVSNVRLYREGVATVLAATGRVKIVDAVGAPDISSLLPNLSVDVVLCDAALLNSHDLAEICSNSPAKFIAFAVSEVETDILACAASGVNSFVHQDASSEEILEAIDGALLGELPCPPRIAGILFERLSVLARSHDRWRIPRGFTSRELEVIALLNQGQSNKQIARQLSIGVSTVKNHVHNILEKLNVHRRGEATAALRRA